jgi:hypothetical protein
MAHAQIPADAEQNDLGFEVPPFERVLIAHEANSFAVFD